MDALFFLLPIALALGAVAVGFFIWAVRRGQFDDLDTPPVRMLHDDEPVPRHDIQERGAPAPLAPVALPRHGDGETEAPRALPQAATNDLPKESP